MRKLLVSVALATATIVTAAPAVAQPGWHQRAYTRGAVNDLLRDLNRAETQIQRAAQRRAISPREASSLRREAATVRVRLNIAARGGINGREFLSLRSQVNRLEQRVRLERRDNDRRPY
jgi:hypothetical protein